MDWKTPYTMRMLAVHRCYVPCCFGWGGCPPIGQDWEGTSSPSISDRIFLRGMSLSRVKPRSIIAGSTVPVRPGSECNYNKGECRRNPIMNSLEELIHSGANGSESTGHRLTESKLEDLNTRTNPQVSGGGEGLVEVERECSQYCYSTFSGDTSDVFNLFQNDGLSVTSIRPQHPRLPSSPFGAQTQALDAGYSHSTDTSRTFTEAFTEPGPLNACIEMYKNNGPRFHLAVKGNHTFQNIVEKMPDSSYGGKTFEWMKVKRSQPRMGELKSSSNFCLWGHITSTLFYPLHSSEWNDSMKMLLCSQYLLNSFDIVHATRW